MYRNLPNLVLGFHGCNSNTFESVVKKGEQLAGSTNSYDWLGHGIYFWEQNHDRAYEWAKHRFGSEEAAVIGAVIDLGHCLNLTDSASNNILRFGYEILKIRCEITGNDLPQNRPSRKTKDILLRDLDCAVIQQIHDFNKTANLPMYDPVRGIFIEGEPIYSGSEICEKTHVQLCICNPNCIKGYFKPLHPNKYYIIP